MIDTQLLITSLLTGIAVIMALTFHEFSHGYVSYLLGDSTAKQSGRLTLNPLKHLDLIGAICLFVFHFGWAKPVPINPNQYKHFKLGTVLTSLAGPFSNILFAFVALLVYGILLSFTDLKSDHYLIFFLQILVSLNLGLAVFNLLPIPPLDGSKVLFALLPQRAYDFVLTYERYGFIVLVILLLTDVLDNFLFAGVDNILEFLLLPVNAIVRWIAGLL